MGTILGGFTRYLVFRKLGWMNDLTACRVQSVFFVFALTFALFALLRPAFGKGWRCLRWPPHSACRAYFVTRTCTRLTIL